MIRVASVVAVDLRRRRISLAGWCLACVGLVLLLAAAYPTVRDDHELDRTFAGLSPGVRQLLGLSGRDGITSAAGYLNSQLFTNVLPVLLLVLAIGAAGWAVAGDEAAGTLELLLANPVSRSRVALARATAVLAVVTIPTVVTSAALAVAAKPAGLGSVPPVRLLQATVATELMALSYAGVAFAVGAATGRRGVAVGAAAALATAGYVVEGLTPSLPALRPVRQLSPWHWLLASDPVGNGLVLQAWLPPLAVAVALVGCGVLLFRTRDLRA